MITQPVFNSGVFSKRIETSFSGAALTAYDQVLSMGSIISDKSFASYSVSNNRIDLLKTGKYLLEIDLYAMGNHAHAGVTNNTEMQWRLENQAATTIAQLRSFKTTSPSITNNSFSSSTFFNQVTSVGTAAMSGLVPAVGGNSATYNCRLFYSEEMNLNSGDWLRLWVKASSVNSGSLSFGLSGYIHLTQIT